MAEEMKKDEILEEKNEGTENTNPDGQDEAEGTEDPKSDDKKDGEKKGFHPIQGLKNLGKKVKEDPVGCAKKAGVGVLKFGAAAGTGAVLTAVTLYKVGQSIQNGTAGTGDTDSPVNEDGTVNSTAKEVNDNDSGSKS